MKMWRWSVFLLLFIHSIHADRIARGKSSPEELGPQIQPSIESDDNRRQFFINVNAIPGPGVIFFTATYYITQFFFGAFFLVCCRRRPPRHQRHLTDTSAVAALVEIPQLAPGG
jgi:hypothetical protein